MMAAFFVPRSVALISVYFYSDRPDLWKFHRPFPLKSVISGSDGTQKSGDRKWCRQKGSRQSTPLSTIRAWYGISVSTPKATRTGKTLQNSLQKGGRYGISVSTPHRRYGHRLRTPSLRTPFPRLLKKASIIVAPKGSLGGNADHNFAFYDLVAGALRGNTIRGNTTRNSERKMAPWEFALRGPLKNFRKPLKTSENLSNPLKTSKNLWKPLKPSLSEILSETLSEADFPLRTSQSCCP